ncbi:hypothetical protein COB57_01335 [Candidatus Peregrinibacteria bacterium]|nr:MAG: hypothetical protein COB57_01335 [Candidatus Peregrinibacteria bacterium]
MKRSFPNIIEVDNFLLSQCEKPAGVWLVNYYRKKTLLDSLIIALGENNAVISKEKPKQILSSQEDFKQLDNDLKEEKKLEKEITKKIVKKENRPIKKQKNYKLEGLHIPSIKKYKDILSTFEEFNRDEISSIQQKIQEEITDAKTFFIKEKASLLLENNIWKGLFVCDVFYGLYHAVEGTNNFQEIYIILFILLTIIMSIRFWKNNSLTIELDDKQNLLHGAGTIIDQVSFPSEEEAEQLKQDEGLLYSYIKSEYVPKVFQAILSNQYKTSKVVSHIILSKHLKESSYNSADLDERYIQEIAYLDDENIFLDTEVKRLLSVSEYFNTPLKEYEKRLTKTKTSENMVNVSQKVVDSHFDYIQKVKEHALEGNEKKYLNL